MSSGKGLRQSKRLASPDMYVTVEIHNRFEKNKFKQHRSSVLNELKATEIILNESLNRQSNMIRSSFAPISKTLTSDKSFKIIKRPQFKLNSPKISELNMKQSQNQDQIKYKMSPEIDLKLKQLTNITGQFERACEKKKKSKKYICQTQKSYYLPVVQESQVEGLDKENSEHKKRKKNWKDKLKKGKELVLKIKDNPNFYNKLREMILRQQQNEMNEKNAQNETIQSIYERFTAPLIEERKSAPINMTCKGFYNSFCAPKIEKSNYYDRKIELEPINSLQEFATGGDRLPFRESSDHVNVGEFMRNRERMSFLKHVYNSTKEKCSQLKDIKCSDFKEPNMMALVYYMEHQCNLTVGERKLMRKRLQFVD